LSGWNDDREAYTPDGLYRIANEKKIKIRKCFWKLKLNQIFRRALFKPIIIPNHKPKLSAYYIYCNKETQNYVSSQIISEPANGFLMTLSVKNSRSNFVLLFLQKHKHGGNVISELGITQLGLLFIVTS